MGKRFTLKRALSGRTAWTGGTTPTKKQAGHKVFKKLKRKYFREQIGHVGGVKGLGHSGSRLDHARTLYKRAKLDAHATMRSTHKRYERKWTPKTKNYKQDY